MDLIFEQVAAELLFTPERPRGVEDTQQVPVVRREPDRTITYAGHQDHQLPAPAGSGVDDGLVQRTWNGLRPDDLALPQPPQDPEWRPDGDR